MNASSASRISAIIAVMFACMTAFSQNTLRRDVEYLSSPLNGGRAFQTRGLQNAADYISRRFRQAGLDVSIQAFKTESGQTVHNVTARTPGCSDTGRRVLVCAHYDCYVGSEQSHYPAADANASGIAAMLSLADSLSSDCPNVEFAAFDGYTEGFLGARRFAEDCGEYSVVINLDTIGSTLNPPSEYRPDYIIVLGGERYERELNSSNIGPRLRIYFDYFGSRDFTRIFYRTMSDHVPFLEKGIPCVMCTSGITMVTNKPCDTPDMLDYPVFERRIELLRSWILMNSRQNRTSAQSRSRQGL